MTPAPAPPPRRPRHWTDADITTLTNAWIANTDPKTIAEMLGRSTSGIETKASRLGLVGAARQTVPGYIRKPTSDHAGMRTCIRCRREFLSSGASNRMCRGCKRSG